MHRKVAAALVAALALGVASCGESSEPLTRQEVVRRIETACRESQQQGAEAARNARGQDSFFAGILVVQRELEEGIEGLEGSDAVADEIETLQSNLAERTDLLARVADASRAEQQRAMAAVEDRVESTSRAIEGAFRRLGVRACG